MNPKNYHREKAFNAITYFVEHTLTCFKTKTYKLLWFLDSEHFKATGRTVTGYDYFAWKMGPVPTELDEAIDSSDSEFTEHFDITVDRDSRYTYIELKPKRAFERKYFSRREMALMAEIANRFRLTTAKELEDLTHLPGTPWYQVWAVENRKQEKIPYEYVLSSMDDAEKETILTIAEDHRVFLANTNELRHSSI
jgi:uncharacterized phage-associated protein